MLLLLLLQLLLLGFPRRAHGDAAVSEARGRGGGWLLLLLPPSGGTAATARCGRGGEPGALGAKIPHRWSVPGGAMGGEGPDVRVPFPQLGALRVVALLAPGLAGSGAQHLVHGGVLSLQYGMPAEAHTGSEPFALADPVVTAEVPTLPEQVIVDVERSGIAGGGARAPANSPCGAVGWGFGGRGRGGRSRGLVRALAATLASLGGLFVLVGSCH